MVMSIRKISTESEDMYGAGAMWFPNLNEPDPYFVLPIAAALLNYFNLSRGITKENEHWYVNRFRTFFSVLQFFHLPFTHMWPAGAFIYWISSSSFMFVQSTLMRKQWFLNKVNPNFFYDYAKMFGERSPKNHDNYVERILNSEDYRLK
jgi:membrane protein insertase Oxa1/YidC/SpoIIIJ